MGILNGDTGVMERRGGSEIVGGVESWGGGASMDAVAAVEKGYGWVVVMVKEGVLVGGYMDGLWMDRLF